MKHTVYLSLGSNLGDRIQNLSEAILHIKRQIGEIFSQSVFYMTKPWGFQSENKFINAAIGVKTRLSPLTLLDSLQQIEREMGRTHKTENRNYADRQIDIDILFYDDCIIDCLRLKIPHPLLHLRRFVLVPLCEIAPAWKHPLLDKPIKELLLETKKEETEDIIPIPYYNK